MLKDNQHTSGVVFDIQRFSINDGPGIRTTVFLKGCPLECKWCHNPESQSFKPQLSFNSEKCLNCFECVAACENGTHKISSGKHVIDWSLCKANGSCVNVCSSGALQIIGRNKSVDDIVNEVMKDVKYYEKTGGGVTISGGEPLFQFRFVKELMTELKRLGIHTSLDTCGFVKEEFYEEILPYTDLFLFDYKMTDNEKHKEYTGVDNNLILSNLEFLYRNGAEIILRCPVIPGINDDNEHFNGIKQLIEKYPRLKSVEIMPYHNMGRDKTDRIGKSYELPSVPNTDEITKEKWRTCFMTDKLNVIIN